MGGHLGKKQDQKYSDRCARCQQDGASDALQNCLLALRPAGELQIDMDAVINRHTQEHNAKSQGHGAYPIEEEIGDAYGQWGRGKRYCQDEQGFEIPECNDEQD